MKPPPRRPSFLPQTLLLLLLNPLRVLFVCVHVGGRRRDRLCACGSSACRRACGPSARWLCAEWSQGSVFLALLACGCRGPPHHHVSGASRKTGSARAAGPDQLGVSAAHAADLAPWPAHVGGRPGSGRPAGERHRVHLLRPSSLDLPRIGGLFFTCGTHRTRAADRISSFCSTFFVFVAVEPSIPSDRAFLTIPPLHRVHACFSCCLFISLSWELRFATPMHIPAQSAL